ncbi:threonine/serine exporter family protein [uncultured Endozoicomonas sp.]|uniref:threonine/serine ThrE exporter family protein n=1 Tax=uncultured Endozoicomonas sp. TaxID=432652 RepID=UPI002601C1DF|nr:threonine/serine exporter family protein [uncultured Endozoicomonas sp.]
MDRKTYRQRRDFLVALGQALHKFGTPAFRLESHMLNVCHTLGLEGYFIVSPTLLTVVLWIPEISSKRHNYHIRVKPGDLDLGSLAKTDQLVDDVVSETISVAEASVQLKEILSAPAPYSLATTYFAFGITSAAFAMLIGFNWAEVWISFLAGIVVFSMICLLERFSSSNEALDPLVALAAALFSGMASYWFPQINVHLVVLSGIIVFIPGLSITLALKDLAARHLISGTSRLMDSLLCLCKLYFGSALGNALVKLFWEQPATLPISNIPAWMDWIAIPLLSLSLVIVFKNRLRDIPWSLLCCFIAFGGARFGAEYLGEGMGPFVGALLVGIYSNIWSRITNKSSLIILLHGVVLLVPGSKAYIGLDSAINGVAFIDLPQIGVHTFMMFMSILAGLIFARLLFPARKLL